MDGRGYLVMGEAMLSEKGVWCGVVRDIFGFLRQRASWLMISWRLERSMGKRTTLYLYWRGETELDICIIRHCLHYVRGAGSPQSAIYTVVPTEQYHTLRSIPDHTVQLKATKSSYLSQQPAP